MKKVLLAIVSMLCVVCCFALAACGSKDPGYNETFTGYVSEQTYETTEAAAQAFLEEEMSGITSDTTFVAYTTTSTLTEEEIDGLELSAAERAKVTSAEKGTVTYTETKKATDARARASAPTKSKEIYILKEGSVFKYYVPAMVDGSELTKSYYDYVFDKSKYENFTVTGQETVGVDYDMFGENTSLTIPASYTYKVTKNALYMTTSSLGQTTEFLFVNTSGGLKKFVNDTSPYLGTNGWVPIENSIYGSIYDIVQSIDTFVSQLNYDLFDQTYFVKTANGFACRPDRYSEMCKIMYKQIIDEDILGSIGGEIVDQMFDSMENVSINFFVSNGRIADCNGRLVINFDYSSMGYSDMTLREDVSFNYHYSNYGTTTVDIPAEVQAYL